MAVSNREQFAAATVTVLETSSSDRVTPVRLIMPEGVQPYRVDWRSALTIAWCHAMALLALLALMPMFFRRSAVVVAIVGARLFGLPGINIGDHRRLTHRGFNILFGSNTRWW